MEGGIPFQGFRWHPEGPFRLALFWLGFGSIIPPEGVEGVGLDERMGMSYG
jgi:hypothetical protein